MDDDPYIRMVYLKLNLKGNVYLLGLNLYLN